MKSQIKSLPTSLIEPLEAGRITSRAWLITGMLIIFQMINFADKAVLGLVAEPAMRELGMSSSQFGFIGSSFFFLFAISSIAVGFLAAKIQTRWILLVMGIAWAVLQFPMLMGGGVTLLLVTRIILGAAEGPATPITLQHIHGWYAPKERGLPSSLVAIGSTLGPIIAAPILAAIIAHPSYGWRWAFGFLGFFGLGWSLLWFLIAKEGPYSHIKAKQQLTQPKPLVHPSTSYINNKSIAEFSDQLKVVPLFKVFISPMFISAFLAGAGCFWAMGFLTTWSPRYLSAVIDTSPQMIGMISTFPWIFGALTLLVAGYLSKILMKKGCSVHKSLGCVFGILILMSGIFFLLLPYTTGIAAVGVLTIAAGLAMTFPLAPITLAYSICSKQRAAVMATVTALASLGGMISPTMVGMFMESAGYIQPVKGILPDAIMLNKLVMGMNLSFSYIGIYLLIVGLAAVIFLNPDRTAKKMQKDILKDDEEKV